MKKHILTIAMAMAAFTAGAATPTEALWLRDVQISPDGSTIVFCYKGDIYTMPAKGGEVTRLTAQTSYECSPVWSADGKHIAFASDRHGNFDVFTMPAEGGAATRLTFNSAAEVPQAFSPDGQWVYFGAQIQDPAESAMFPTGTLPELYRVPAAGGRTEQVLGTPAEMLCFAPDAADGTALSFYYQDKKGYEDEWRKHHTSSITRDIWFYDATTGQHTNLTRHAGEDRNPIVSPDGTTLYYLSERDGGSMNVYKAVKGSKCSPLGGDAAIEAQPVTHFTTHPVRFLSMARTGTLCYTYNGEIYTQRPGAEPQRLHINITRDDSSEQVVDLAFSNGAKESTVSRDGKQVAFVVRGEVFVTSTEYATTRQISQTAGAECGVDFAPDGRSLIYASERDGHWQLYIAKIARDEDPNFANATVINEQPLFATASAEEAKALPERCWPQFSPDGKKVAFIEDRTRLMVVDLATMEVSQVTDGSKWYDQDGRFSYQWSPDGKWFVLDFIAHQRDPYYDQGIVSVDGGEIHPITDSGYMTGGAKWVMDGKAILFQSERYGMRSHASWGSQDDVFLAFLTQDAYDRYRLSPEDYALLKEVEAKAKEDAKAAAEAPAPKGKKGGKKDAPAAKADAPQASAEVFDFAGIEDRIVRLTPNSSSIGDAILSQDGEKLYFYTAFEGGQDLWKIDLRKHETKLLSKTNSKAPSLCMDKDGNIYALGSDAMKKIDGKSEALTPITFAAKMKLDLAAERNYMYHHMAKQIEKKLFWTAMLEARQTEGVKGGGCDWPMMVENYERFLPHIANNYDFQELLSEILGELNVSHTGGRYYAMLPNADATAQLGLLYDQSAAAAGRIVVTEVLEGGPFDRATSKVKAGDEIVAINGESVEGKDLAQLLNLMANKKTLVSFKGAAGEWDEVVLPISASRQADLLYDRWVKGRAAEVERLSGGRLGYVHIKGMNDASYRSVYSDILGKFNQKEGIVIDTRYNGGGRLHEDIEVLFSGQHYFTQVIRGREVCDMPSRRYNHPSIMLQAEGNYSNAHGTPWVYNHKQMGKLVGSPVPGTMSSVNWERMQDETLVFGCPVIGYQLPDGSYLENSQLEPDIYILNNPATVVKGEDLQLEAAVRALLDEIDGK
ncbi:MAG: S41 family peptidase [Bacteroidales bacterium]|nr:S41 family peptidase [Bacteroidales bacterium]